MNRYKDQRFKRDYTNQQIIDYLKGAYKLLGKAPTFRDIQELPGPASRTIIRRFGYWSAALKKAGIRPHTHQLKKGEKSFIRQSWRRMTDKQIASKLGVTEVVIKYYRKNYNLWKNRKGTAKSTFRKRALNLYGDSCEVCGIPICELHHINPKSKNEADWCILCPTCHAVITRKLVEVRSRKDLNTRLLPYIKTLHKNFTLTN